MKLGKKLDVTDIKERLKLLIDGEVFYNFNGFLITLDASFMGNGGSPFRSEKDKSSTALFRRDLELDWYYLPKEYTINGVTLTDERIKLLPRDPVGVANVYISDPLDKDLARKVSVAQVRDLLVSRGLAHYTEEAAIAHTNAMIRVSE